MQVTRIPRDTYALWNQVIVEEKRPLPNAAPYLCPEVRSQPASLGIGLDLQSASRGNWPGSPELPCVRGRVGAAMALTITAKLLRETTMSRSVLLAIVILTLLTSPGRTQTSPSPSVDGAFATIRAPAVARGTRFQGFRERFNRYYTQPSWKPATTVYVSPSGGGDGTSRASPTTVASGLAAAQPGTLVFFLRGSYNGCYGFDKGEGGTYRAPIVLFGERNANKSPGVTMSCCTTGRQACFNFEAANYVAVDGFELVGGLYGVRAVGEDYAASKHSRGIAVLNSRGRDQERDPFFSGQADWAVWEGNLAYGAKEGDGHGIYLSNGSDWNIVRFNETHSNASSDFQVNSDPISTCADVGIPFADPRCDDYAGTGEGGRGASDYFLIDSNYFHRSSVGPNFTGLRRSKIVNNIFGPQQRHNVSFWQETDNPKLGSRENRILHNLFITTDRHGVQFINDSSFNHFTNNVLLAVRIGGGGVRSNSTATLMEVDSSVDGNVYRSNLYASGRIEGRRPNAKELVRAGVSAKWYAQFPTEIGQSPNGFAPTAKAPFLSQGAFTAQAPVDRNGVERSGRVDLGPFERP